jgi:hypothetical protein
MGDRYRFDPHVDRRGHVIYRIVTVAALVALTGLLLPGAVAGKAAQNRLVGTVGGGADGNEFRISLVDEAGNRVSQLNPGTYTIEVRDLADFHNFHLSGPGVNMRTGIGDRETVTWTVTFAQGVYTYLCDPHPTQMRGSFRVGNPSPPPPPPAGGPRRLSGSVGPGSAITLKSGARKVSRLAAGTYRVTVRDRTVRDNFHLTGPGVNRRTGVRFRGTASWTVRFRRGSAYRYVSDANRRRLRGSFRAT